MCMIAHRFLGPKGKGSNIPNIVISTGLTRHPDGYGIAWRDPEQGLLYDKFGPEDKRLFSELLKEIDAIPTIEYVAHFRFATHGPEDEAHAHPYAYMDPDPKVGQVLVFHNGVISGVTTTTAESDTEVFVRDFLAKLPSRWWNNTGIRKLVDHMGGWSKIVLMTQDETVNLNHYDGHEAGGLWYSSEEKPYSGYSVTSYSGKGYTSHSGTKFDTDELLDDYERYGVGDYRPKVVTKSADIGTMTYPRTNESMWLNAGHELSPLQKFDFAKDGDFEASVVCDTCGTAGDVYIVDGKAYVDIPHAWDIERDKDVPEEDRTEFTTVTPVTLLPSAVAVVPQTPIEDLLPGAEQVITFTEKSPVALLN